MDDQARTKEQLINELKELRRSEEHCRRMLNEMSDGYLVTREERIMFANQPLADMLSCSVEDLIGRSWKEFLTPDVATYIDQTPMTDLPPLLNAHVRRPDGSQLVVEAVVHPATYEGELAEFTLVRDITERRRAEEQVRRRNRDLAVLNRVIAEAASTGDVERILKVACRELARAFDLPQAAAALLNAEGTQLDIVAEYLEPGRASGLGQVIPVVGNPATRYVLRRKEPLAVTDAQTDERLAPVRELMRQRGTLSLLIVPLMVRHEVVGTLGLDAIERREFSASEIDLAQNVATAAGPALERAQLHQALRHHAERLETLLDIGHAILAAQSPQEIAQAAMRHIRQLVPCQRISFTLFDFERQEANLLAVHADGETQIGENRRFTLEDFNIPAPLWQNQVYRVEDVLEQAPPSTVNQTLQDEGLRSYINVPLMAREELIGSLNLGSQSPNAFAPEHIEIAREAAAQLAVAIYQARLQGELQRHTENLEMLVKERTAELQIALERAKSADRVKSEFVSNVSHELRTPLTNLKLYLGLLTRGRPNKRPDYMNTLRREADRLENLIEDLLDLSRLDLGKTRAHLQPVDLNLLVSTLVNDRAALAADRGLRLRVELDKDLPPVLADTKLVDQVLTNLLTNAINYTPTGGIVTLCTRPSEAQGRKWSTVDVIDTGLGIAPEEQSHLFERFYRGKAGRASDAPGTGLGLAISKEIVDMHGGQIAVQSRGVPGEGSTFTVRLPPA